MGHGDRREAGRKEAEVLGGGRQKRKVELGQALPGAWGQQCGL